MKHPNPDMLLRIAQGDAFCAATEYLKDTPRDREVKEQALKFKKFGQHPKHLDLKPGMYTDDTQMSIAVAEVLISGRPFTREKFADAFVTCFKRDERKGYSKGFQGVLEEVHNGAELLAVVHPDSDKNGAAMRAVPIGVLPTVTEVLEVAKIQAEITHNTPDGILSAQAVALMSHFALYEAGPFSTTLPGFMDRHLPEFLKIRSKLNWGPEAPVTGPRVGIKTAIAVYDLVTQFTTLNYILRVIIQWGGDTDSVAAIAWGIASTRMSDEVPEFLETGLEPGRKYGVDFLKSLGAQLMAAV